MNHDAVDDTNAAATTCLPRDVLTSVFLRLPATDLRRFRHVCKEWRQVISDPVFIKEYMDHGPWAATHTIVFLHGREESDKPTEPHNGHGFLFDEDWQIVAGFTAGETEEMVGTCNGLLCFLDVHHGAIKVVEPFTGKSLTLPLPPKTEMLDDEEAYCFGFDPGSRRYKIFHLGLNWSHTDDTTKQGLYVYTIGGGENWLHIAGSAEAGKSYRDPMLVDGSLYWPVKADQLAKLARFDLATEEISSTPFIHFLPLDYRAMTFNLMTDSDTRMCVRTDGWSGEYDVFSTGEDGHWTQNNYSGLTLPFERHYAWRQALQRGHLLLQDHRDGGLYAHRIEPGGHDLRDRGSCC